MNASEILTLLLNNLPLAGARQFRDGSAQTLMLEWEINARTMSAAPAFVRAADKAQADLMKAGEDHVFTVRASHGSIYLRIRAPLRECSAPSTPAPMPIRPAQHIHDTNTRMLAGQITRGATWRLRRHDTP